MLKAGGPNVRMPTCGRGKRGGRIGPRDSIPSVPGPIAPAISSATLASSKPQCTKTKAAQKSDDYTKKRTEVRNRGGGGSAYRSMSGTIRIRIAFLHLMQYTSFDENNA